MVAIPNPTPVASEVASPTCHEAQVIRIGWVASSTEAVVSNEKYYYPVKRYVNGVWVTIA